MNIYLNGQATEISQTTLDELIQQLNLESKRFAVEIDEQIISKSKFSQTVLYENAKVEIIQAVGGG